MQVIRIPQNLIILESGDFSINQIVELLRKYKDNSTAIEFIADMMEE